MTEIRRELVTIIIHNPSNAQATIFKSNARSLGVGVSVLIDLHEEEENLGWLVDDVIGDVHSSLEITSQHRGGRDCDCHRLPGEIPRFCERKQ